MKKEELDLPFNADAEKQVLANMLFSNQMLAETISRLEADDFYLKKNQIIYNALVKVHEKKGVTVDESSLLDELNIENALDDAGGASYLLELTSAYNDMANAMYYIDSVEEKSILRQLIIASNDVVDNWKKESNGDMGNYISTIYKRYDTIVKKRKVESLVPIATAFKQFNEKVKLSRLREVDDNIKTGYSLFDKCTNGGFKPGEMIVLAARPAVGKSALALNILYKAALKTTKPCIFFSLEMDIGQVVNRILSAKSAVPMKKLQNATFDTQEEIAINQAIKSISESKLYIDESTSLKLADIRAKLTKLKSQEGSIGLVVIDYLGLITPDVKAKGDQNRSVIVGQISAGVKQLARDFKCPVLVLSQLNREGDNTGRDGKAKKPGLTNLRESGSIEQDADMVLFIHREDYGKPEEANDSNDDDKHSDSAVEVYASKNRNGELFSIDFMFQKHIGRFVEMDKTREN